ncbi:hypothetical protein [Tumebacillus permanentifrigoris]|uniref:Uncharacterized protein n=1 Tax=Tumebacillus permanentifrigoris TaxID=378543 RepID=A0A316D2X1_9BACL|nr:hypothetical protein [Tumebacillus permanentifrigoris]PWK05293.1 hypothetical protein C7459_12442 [Tumebacillus permanentifrigoris]
MQAGVDVGEKVAELNAKMDMVISQLNTFQHTNMPRAETESRFERQGERTGRLEARVRDLEAAPHKWLSLVVSMTGVGIALMAFLTKH